MKPNLYVFSGTASKESNIKVVSFLYIDISPESAIGTAFKALQKDYPDCIYWIGDPVQVEDSFLVEAYSLCVKSNPNQLR